MMDEVRARLLPPGEWMWRMRAPYRVMAQDTDTLMWVMSEETPYAEAAILSVIGADGFPNEKHRVAVIDRDGWILLGYSTDPVHVNAFGHPAWWGSEFGFMIAESTGVLDPVELAMMESFARDMSDGDGWWQQ